MTSRSSWRQTLNPKHFHNSLSLGSIIAFPYVTAIVWQYFATIKNQGLAWTITALISLVAWYVYVTLKETESTALPWQFWLLVALPLLAVFLLRADFPDVSFDVLNYHLFQSERVLRGSFFIQGDFFPAASPINPTPDILTGLYRYLLGYRLGTIANYLALIWTGLILNRLLFNYIRSAWFRSLSILFILFTEQMLFQINNYMVDLLALPLLLEAMILAIAPMETEKRAKRTAILALLLGVATAFKLTNLFVAVPIVLVYVFNSIVGPDGKRNGRELAGLVKSLPLAAILFVAPAAPFSLLVYRLSGNPIFPLYNGIFKSPFWPQGAVLDPRWGPWGTYETAAWPGIMFFQPWRLNEFTYYSGRLTVGYFLAAVCLFIARGDRRVRAIAFVTLLGTILWSASSGYIRYALFFELTSGILLTWLISYLWRKFAHLPIWAKLLAQTPIWLLVLAQTCLAVSYINRWEWSRRQPIFSRDQSFRKEYQNFFRDRSLRSYLAREDLALFDDVDVWIETTDKTSVFEGLLKPKTPVISVRMPHYFDTTLARTKFGETLQAAQGKRMYTLTTNEGIDKAQEALAARGLLMGKKRAASINYFSRSLKFEMLLVEVFPSWQNNSGESQKADKGLPLPDLAFMAGLTAPNTPGVMKAGQKYTIRISLRNDSKIVWPGLQPTWQYQLTVGNRWLTETGNKVNDVDGRVALFQDLAPNEIVELPLTVTAPTVSGTYVLQFDAIQEGVAWFGDRGSQVLSFRIRVE